jgi:hypothetical protein
MNYPRAAVAFFEAWQSEAILAYEVTTRFQDSEIEIQYAVTLEWSRLVTDSTRLPVLKEFHILHDSVIEERFCYDEVPGIHVGFVRGFRLVSPRRLAMQKSFGGCRSWLDLPGLEGVELMPVISDEEHAARRHDLQALLG